MRIRVLLPLALLALGGLAMEAGPASAAIADPDAWAGRVVESLSHGTLDPLDKVLQDALVAGPPPLVAQAHKQHAALMKQLRARLEPGAPSAGEQIDAQRIGGIFRRYAFAARNGRYYVLLRFDLEHAGDTWNLSNVYYGTDLNYVMRGSLPGAPDYDRRR